MEQEGGVAVEPRAGEREFPQAVDLILSALETGRHTQQDRRLSNRFTFRSEAAVRFFSDSADIEPRRVYTCNANRRGLGFITDHRLPLGHGGTVELTGPDGEMIRASFTLIRCREAAPGWYEGALHFVREQPAFCVDLPEELEAEMAE